LCTKSVYFAERLVFKGEVWHRQCFRCHECQKGMKTAAEASDHDGNPYCPSCHGKLFGPKGYGYGQGAGVMRPANDYVNKNITRNTRVESQNFNGIKDTSGVSKQVGETEKQVREASRKEKEQQQQRKNGPANSGIRTTFGGSPKCPVCGKSVYFAEKLAALGETYHKMCFKCNDCGKTMATAAEGSDAEGLVWCKACYAKNFGPKGIGYGNALVDTGKFSSRSVIFPYTTYI